MYDIRGLKDGSVDDASKDAYIKEQAKVDLQPNSFISFWDDVSQAGCEKGSVIQVPNGGGWHGVVLSAKKDSLRFQMVSDDGQILSTLLIKRQGLSHFVMYGDNGVVKNETYSIPNCSDSSKDEQAKNVVDINVTEMGSKEALSEKNPISLHLRGEIALEDLLSHKKKCVSENAAKASR